jgi:hypothetical protein
MRTPTTPNYPILWEITQSEADRPEIVFEEKTGPIETTIIYNPQYYCPASSLPDLKGRNGKVTGREQIFDDLESQ